MKRVVLAAVAVMGVAWAAPVAAQTLTNAQLQTLKTSVAAASDLVTTAADPLVCGNYVGQAINSLANSADQNACIAAMYNLNASPTFIVWKTSVPKRTVGQTFNASEFANLTTANTSRLSAYSDWIGDTINPSLADVRQFFSDVFSVGGITSAALTALWKRSATRFERLYTTGTGSDPQPGQLVIEGVVSGQTINAARNLP